MAGLSREEHAIVMRLLHNRRLIDRDVQEIKHNNKEVGSIANTTSESANVADALKQHLNQMHARLPDGPKRVVRNCDPLYRELFDRYDEIETTITTLKNGVSVSQIGENDCAIALIKKHRSTVTGFVERGGAEVMSTHSIDSNLCT
jgi:hypothetical protein